MSNNLTTPSIRLSLEQLLCPNGVDPITYYVIGNLLIIISTEIDFDRTSTAGVEYITTVKVYNVNN